MKASMINFSYFHKPFIFFHHRNAICTVPTILYYALNKRTHIHIIVLYKIILIYTLLKTTSPSFSVSELKIHVTIFHNFTYCIKDTNLYGILRNYDPVTQMYIFCPITKTFNDEESRPFLIPHEFIQPIEIPILEFIHNTKYNHKIYNLIQNTPYEFAVGTEQLNTINALQLLWPLLQTKNIIRILANLLTTSDMIHDIFPHGFLTED